MPRDPEHFTIAPAATAATVCRLADGPLGPRLRVRGLRGSPGLARWLTQSLRLPAGARVSASADSGILRIDARRARQIDVDRLCEAIAIECAAYGGTSPATAPAAAAVAATGTPAADARAPALHAGTMATALRRVRGSFSGLDAADARARLKRDGANELKDITARADLAILADQFASVPVGLLAGSGAVALAARDFADAAAIGTVLAANGGIGYITERRAEQTVSSLRRLAPQSAIVLRDGREQSVPAREVVVGDILILKPGAQVAADARVIESHRLSVNEAALTGESLPVRKEPADTLAPDTPLALRRNMLHMGTVVSGGAGRALVVATGARTVLGGIRAVAQGAEAPRTRLQTELDGLGKRLAIGASVLCGGLFVIGLVRGRPLLPLVRTAVSLGVAAIPEGLPTVATSLLAAGIRKLQKQNVYARRLDAIENLGAVDVVGFDKTGTLTQNRMSVAELHLGQPLKVDPQHAPALPADALLVCALCHELAPPARDGEAWQGSATELALAELARAAGADLSSLRRRHPRLAIKQRSEHHPYMVTLHAEGGSALVAMKGRPAEVLERCARWFDGRRVVTLTIAQRRRLRAANDAMAARGQRVLALAIKRQRARTLSHTEGLTWLGLVGLADPVRPGIAESIARFRAAGIRTVMLTGDQLGTAEAVAREIGLDGRRAVTDAGALPEEPQALRAVVDRVSGFARSSPAMKLAIIRALQAQGHVVAMTGDGINDGPALKTADVGVAMGASGTDFAQAMSDLVLKDDHPDGLLAAIAEGRTAYLNVKKAVRYLVATNVSELALMATTMAAGLPDPLDPMALLWTNLITDVSPAIALGLEPPEPDILQRPPFPRSHALLDRKDWQQVGLDGALITAAALAAYLYGLGRYGASPRARTLAFSTMASAQLLYALSARSEAPLALLGKGRLRRNRWLSRTVLLSLGAQAATVLFPPLRRLLRTTPIGLVDAAVVASLAVAPTLTREAIKRVRAAGKAHALAAPSTPAARRVRGRQEAA